ncbi:MAG: BMP family ABC transporter substrate-binding protein [Bacillota bacterium]|nr:BMP family ABC transporter substrate-binding protein [Bacillota bacterium]
MRIKKSIAVMIALMTAMAMFTLTGCQDEEAEQPEEMIDYEIALITDEGLISDRGTSEAVWETIIDFGSAKGISHKYYKATEAKPNAVADVLDNAVQKGAKVIVVEDNEIADCVFEKQEDYKDTAFIAINADPYDSANGDIRIRENTVAVTFAGEQAGFMAGYAAVMEGYTDLGVLTEGKTTQDHNVTLGFAKGANRAARELGVTAHLRCAACGEETPRIDAANKAAEWYQNGTQVIFAWGDRIEDTVIGEAETCDGKVIAGITDKGEISDTVLISAVEDIDTALKAMLTDYFDGHFKGGEIVTYGVSDDAISLDYRNSRMQNYVKDEYDALYDQIKSGKIKIKVDGVENVKDLDLSNIEF